MKPSRVILCGFRNRQSTNFPTTKEETLSYLETLLKINTAKALELLKLETTRRGQVNALFRMTVYLTLPKPCPSSFGF